MNVFQYVEVTFHILKCVKTQGVGSNYPLGKRGVTMNPHGYYYYGVQSSIIFHML